MPNITAKRKKTKAKDKPEAFEKARERLSKKRAKRDLSTHWAHFWNVCPKCGGDMFEQKINSIFFEVCRKCHGIYIDKPELDLALKFLDPAKFMKDLSRKAKKPKTP